MATTIADSPALSSEPARASSSPAAYSVPLPRPGLLWRVWHHLGWNVAVLVEVAVIFAIWEALASARLLDAQLLPPPSRIGGAFVQSTANNYLANNLLFSVQNFVVGYLFAAVIGIAVGLLMGVSGIISLVLSPFMWTLYATPRVVLAPLIVIWFGFGWQSKVFIVALMAVFPILLNVLVGTRTVDPSLLRAAVVFGASRLDTYRKVLLPHLVPYALAGLRQGVVRGLTGVVVGEFIGSAAGLGFMINRAASDFDLATGLAVTIVLILIANLSLLALQLAMQRLAPWFKEQTF